jgi:hypothetical protein
MAPNLFTSVSDKKGRDYEWNDLTQTGDDVRHQIIEEIAGVGTNVIFTEYSGAFSEVHFVTNTEKAFMDVFFSSRDVNGPLIIPSLEGSVQRRQLVFDPVRVLLD